MESERARNTFYLGEKFKTFSEFEDKLNSVMKETNQSFVKKSGSNSVKKANNRNKSSKYREELVYTRLRLRCRHEGTFTSTATVRRVSSRKTECPVYMQLKYEAEKDALEITELCLNHNHPLVLPDVRFYRRHRQLTDLEEAEAIRLLKLDPKLGKLRDYLESIAGKAIVLRDLNSMRTHLKAKDAADRTIKEQVQKPESSNQDPPNQSSPCKPESSNQDPSNQGSPCKRETTKRKNASLDVPVLCQTTPAKFQKKTQNQFQNQNFANRKLKVMTCPVQTSLPVCTPMQVQQHSQVATLLPPPPPPSPQPSQNQEQMLASSVQEAAAKPKPVEKLKRVVKFKRVAKLKRIEKPQPQKKQFFVVAGHQRYLMSNLASLWKKGKFCDAGIGNGSLTVKVHKLVLYSLCPKLLSVSKTDIKSHEFLQVNFPKEVSSEALNAFAEYMYTGFIYLDPDILGQLKIIAKRLDMTEFKQLCDNYLPNNTHQPGSATDSSTIISLIQTTPVAAMNSSCDSLHSTSVSTSTQSSPSINNPVNVVKQETSKDKVVQVKRKAAAVFSQDSEVAASLAPNMSVNTVASAVTPSIKTELVGPEDDKYGHWCDDSYVQAFTSTTPSSLSSSSVAEAAASTSIASVPSSSSTEFTIPSSESTNTKSIRLKAPHSYEAPLLSDSPPVSCPIETVCSQSSPTKEEFFKPFIQSSNSSPSIDVPHNNNIVYPVKLFTAKGDNLPLITTLSSDGKTVISFRTCEKT